MHTLPIISYFVLITKYLQYVHISLVENMILIVHNFKHSQLNLSLGEMLLKLTIVKTIFDSLNIFQSKH